MSKDKFTIRRRAAFDTDEKDVTKKDVKTPLLRKHLGAYRVSDHNKMIYTVCIIPDAGYPIYGSGTKEALAGWPREAMFQPKERNPSHTGHAGPCTEFLS